MQKNSEACSESSLRLVSSTGSGRNNSGKAADQKLSSISKAAASGEKDESGQSARNEGSLVNGKSSARSTATNHSGLDSGKCSLSQDSINALHRELQALVARDKDTKELLSVIGENNGWTLDSILHSSHEFVSMELFLLEIPKLGIFKYFPTLTVVKLMHIGLDSMACLSSLTQVEELWVTDNNIAKIEGLQGMANRLRKLYLQGNNIKSMDGFPKMMKHLKELWLCRNEISELSSFDFAPKLRVLWLASNHIKHIKPNTFSSHLAHLKELNFSGNSISSFHELTHLAPLPNLRHVWFSDPLFGINPICALYNYSVITLTILNSIDTLDHAPVSAEQRTQAASMYERKRAYYSMRLNSLDRNLFALRRKIQQSVERKRENVREALRSLERLLIPLEADLQERTFSNDQNSRSDPSVITRKQLSDTVRDLRRAIDTREVELQTMAQRHVTAMNAAQRHSSDLKERLCIELNTGGNIRLEEIPKKKNSSPNGSISTTSPSASISANDNSSSDWFSQISDLILSRFDAKGFQSFGITGIVPQRVHRIVNRGLRICFDDRIRELNIDLSRNKSRKNFICLFGSIPVKDKDQEELLRNILVYGPEGSYPGVESTSGTDSPASSQANEYYQTLTNSILLADTERLTAFLKKSTSELNQTALSGQLIVYRVFTGKNIELGDEIYNSLDVLNLSSMRSSPLVQMQQMRKLSEKSIPERCLSASHTTDSSSGSCIWRFFDSGLLLPEFLVEFTYTSAVPPPTMPPLDLFRQEVHLRNAFTSVLPYLNSPFFSEQAYDIQSVSYPLVSFLQWCTSNSFDQFASNETADAVKKGEIILNEIPNSTSLLVSSSLNKKELTSEIVEGYTRNLLSGSGDMTFCYLHNLGLEVIPKDFKTPLLTSVTTLNLSQNKLKEVSFYALSLAMPNLQRLDISDNNLTSLDFGTTQPSFTFTDLEWLDVQCNQLEELRDLYVLHHCAPALKQLFVGSNPCVDNCKDAEAMLIAYLPRLKQLNEYRIPNTEDIEAPSTSLLSQLHWRTLDFFATVKDSEDQNSGTTIPSDGMISVFQYFLQQAYPHLRHHGEPCPCDFNSSSIQPVGASQAIIFERALDQTVSHIISQSQVLTHRERPISSKLQPPNAASSSSTNPSNIKNAQFFSNITVSTFRYEGTLLQNVRPLDLLSSSLRFLFLGSNFISDFSVILQAHHLEILDLSDNNIRNIPDKISSLKKLRQLYLNDNYIENISNIKELPKLQLLNLTSNRIRDIGTLKSIESLEELYFGSNIVSSIKEFLVLQELPKLFSLDVLGNPCVCEEQEDARYYFIYHFKALRILDGVPISHSESLKAKDELAGKISRDLLRVRLNGKDDRLWDTVKELDLSSCSLREINLLELFPSLEILLLQRNSITTVAGLMRLENLKALNLSFNKLGQSSMSLIGESINKLTQLESLALEYNGIFDFSSMALSLPRLKFLNLKGNELQYLDHGFDRLPQLRELLLDQNKLRSLSTDAFKGCPLLWSLSAEDNGIRSIEGLSSLAYLEELYLGTNRLVDPKTFIQDIRNCPLRRAVFTGNAAGRKLHYKQLMIATFNDLRSLDGQEITEDDHLRALSARASEPIAPPNVFIDLQLPKEVAVNAAVNNVARVGAHMNNIVYHSTTASGSSKALYGPSHSNSPPGNGARSSSGGGLLSQRVQLPPPRTPSSDPQQRLSGLGGVRVPLANSQACRGGRGNTRGFGMGKH